MGIVSRAEDFPLVRETIAMELQIRQKTGTEPLLKDYLSSISAPNDTVYAILYEPTFCPRCEIDIKPYSKMLSELAPQSPFVLITTYPDSARAAAYNKEKGYAADGYIYDTDEVFMRIFSFNTNGLSGLYILKMCKSTGELLVGANSFYTSMEYTKELTGWTERMEQHNFAQASGAAGDEPWQLPRPACEPLNGTFTDHGLKLDGQMLSDVYDVPKFDWPYFFYNDKLNNCVMLFKEDGGSLRFSARIEADSTERDHFIELSDDWKRHLDKSSLCYMPLAATMTDSQRIGVSYSLPHVMEDTIAKNGGLAFFNAPAIVMRDAGTLAKSPMYCPDFMLFKDTTYFYAHFNFCVFKGEVIYSCQKMTWPMMYERWEYEHNPVMNPFSEKFYSSGNPWLAAFSLKTGKLVERFAGLEAERRQPHGLLVRQPGDVQQRRRTSVFRRVLRRNPHHSRHPQGRSRELLCICRGHGGVPAARHGHVLPPRIHQGLRPLLLPLHHGGEHGRRQGDLHREVCPQRHGQPYSRGERPHRGDHRPPHRPRHRKADTTLPGNAPHGLRTAHSQREGKPIRLLPPRRRQLCGARVGCMTTAEGLRHTPICGSACTLRGDAAADTPADDTSHSRQNKLKQTKRK